jgi:hypothetical protein
MFMHGVRCVGLGRPGSGKAVFMDPKDPLKGLVVMYNRPAVTDKVAKKYRDSLGNLWSFLGSFDGTSLNLVKANHSNNNVNTKKKVTDSDTPEAWKNGGGKKMGFSWTPKVSSIPSLHRRLPLTPHPRTNVSRRRKSSFR